MIIARNAIKYTLIVCIIIAALAKVVAAFNSQRIMVSWAEKHKYHDHLKLEHKKLQLELLTLLSNTKVKANEHKIRDINL